MFPVIRKVAQAVALITFAAAGSGLYAQQTAVPTAAPDFQAALKMPANPFDTVSSSSSSSSSVSAEPADALTTEKLSLGEGMQPPPRRRYGRPRYTDNAHNPDGSSKYTFVVGGGFTLPTGGTKNYAKTSYSFQGGVGRNFNKNVGVIAQFDWDNFGIQTAQLNRLLNLYNSLCPPAQSAAGNCQQFTQLGGGTHIWSFSLNPIYTFAGGEKVGAYVVAGAGFYHKRTDITTPAVGTYCDYYYGCYQYQANQPIDWYTSNAAGVNAGIGFTYKLSKFSNAKVFGEARYVYTANSRRPYYDGTTGTSLSNTYFNAFPQNSAPTTYIPVKFGVRF